VLAPSLPFAGINLMMDYRIYKFGEDGQIVGAAEDRFASDDDAVSVVRAALSQGQRAEIWRGEAVVRTVRGPEVITTVT
jgi:hypothetical protein